MPVYVVAFQRVEDQEKLNEYVAKVGDTIPPEMKVLAIDGAPELIGDRRLGAPSFWNSQPARISADGTTLRSIKR